MEKAFYIFVFCFILSIVLLFGPAWVAGVWLCSVFGGLTIVFGIQVANDNNK